MSLPVPAEQTHLTHPKYRPDIDGLRAVAILSVVGYHAFPSWIKGGFIGVDIFFVISGFLISSIIMSSLEKGTFSFSEFYARRIRRIFPALLLIMAASFSFGWFVLLPDEYKQLGKHIAGGAGFVSNFILWNESGYFDNSAATKPLLHLWSLGIEEQFYILYPPLLWLMWKSRLKFITVTLVVAATSFLLNINQFRADPIADFYSPQTRFWELMFGGILAHLMLYHGNALVNIEHWLKRWPRIYNCISPKDSGDAILRNAKSVVGLLLIALGLLNITNESYFPGWWAILPTMGTALIISAGPHGLVNRIILSHRILVWFGLISYPLYLWHWVLFSFAHLVSGQTPTLEIRIVIVLISITLAWITYQWIEKPIRIGKFNKLKTIILLMVMTLSGVAGYGLYRFNGLDFRNNAQNYNVLAGQWRKWEFRTNQACINKYGWDQDVFCITSSANPEIILFGDSHANQLYPGLIKAYGNTKGVLSLGKSAPLDSVVVTYKKVLNYRWAQGLESYKKVLQEIRSSDEIKTVILSAEWEPLIHGNHASEEKQERFGNISLSMENGSSSSNNLEVFKIGFERTIKNLLLAKKNIVIVIDTPEVMVNPEACIKHLQSKSLCTFKKSDVMQRQQFFRNYMSEISTKYPQVRIFDPVPIVCPLETCNIYNGKYLYYRDSSHVSLYISELIGKELRVLIDSLN